MATLAILSLGIIIFGLLADNVYEYGVMSSTLSLIVVAVTIIRIRGEE
jgi:hypothetical protein